MCPERETDYWPLVPIRCFRSTNADVANAADVNCLIEHKGVFLEASTGMSIIHGAIYTAPTETIYSMHLFF